MISFNPGKLDISYDLCTIKNIFNCLVAMQHLWSPNLDDK